MFSWPLLTSISSTSATPLGRLMLSNTGAASLEHSELDRCITLASKFWYCSYEAASVGTWEETSTIYACIYQGGLYGQRALGR